MGFLEVALSVLRKFDDKFQLRQTSANDSPPNLWVSNFPWSRNRVVSDDQMMRVVGDSDTSDTLDQLTRR
jgi:hypothetical protein